MSICVSLDYLSGKAIILYLEQMQVEVGSKIPMVSLSYGKYGGLVTKGWISRKTFALHCVKAYVLHTSSEHYR